MINFPQSTVQYFQSYITETFQLIVPESTMWKGDPGASANEDASMIMPAVYPVSGPISNGENRRREPRAYLPLAPNGSS